MHTDRGTCVAVGVSDATFELLNTFYVPYADGIDLVTPVITRAMAAIDELRRTSDSTTRADDHEETEEVDHLTNINEVLRGEHLVRTQVVLTQLAELHPARYEGWTFSDLTAALAEHGIEPVKSGGVKVVRAADTRKLTITGVERIASRVPPSPNLAPCRAYKRLQQVTPP